MKSLREGGALSAALIVCALLVNAREVSAQALPSGWTSRDINTVEGGAISSNGTWTVSGSGANIWDSADAFQFTHRSITGDFDYSVRLTALDAPNEWSKAGVMVRESLAANARNAFVMFSKGTGPALQYRADTGGSTTRVNGSGQLPTWLRLVRQGTRFTAYSSTDSATWTSVGSATLSIGSTAYVGFAVTSRDVGALATASFANVALTAGVQSPGTGTGTGTTTWTGADVGAPALAGSSSNASGTFTVAGAGTDVWGAADQFHYYYQTVQGDAEIIARVGGFQSAWSGSKGGVMIRQSLSAGSPHSLMLASPGYGYAFQRRIAASGTTSHNDGPRGTPPGWVRLVREGDLFSAYHSADGSSWTLVGTDRIMMSGSILVGLAVSSVNPSTRATVTFTNVSVRAPTPAPINRRR